LSIQARLGNQLNVTDNVQSLLSKSIDHGHVDPSTISGGVSRFTPMNAASCRSPVRIDAFAALGASADPTAVTRRSDRAHDDGDRQPASNQGRYRAVTGARAVRCGGHRFAEHS